MTQNTRKIFHYFALRLKKRKWLFIFVFSLAALSAVPAIIAPLYYKKFFDILAGLGTLDERAEKLIPILVIIASFHLLHLVFIRLSNFLGASLQSGTMKDITDHCFDYLHHHSYRFFSNNFIGSLVRKVGRLSGGFLGITDSIIWDLAPLLVRVLAILGVLAFSQPALALIILVWVFIYLITSFAIAKFKLKYDAERAELDSRVTAYLADTVTNQTNVKLFSSFNDEFRSFKNLTQKHANLRKFSWNISTTTEAVQALFMIALEFGVFYVAVKLWREGSATIGDFALIQAYIITLFDWLWGFGRVIRRVYENLADSEEMIEILNTPHEIVDPKKPLEFSIRKAEIQFKNITFGFSDNKKIFTDFNLTIKAGEKVALVGPSGAGKSTLISLLFRFFDVEKGAVLIDGHHITNTKQDSLRDKMSLVPQDPILFHRALIENIRYGKRNASDKDVIKAAKAAHCDKFINLLPAGYSTLVGERGIKLSGGERQRIAIARAILKNAPILVLDEATSSLDSESEHLIQDALDKLMQGKTVLVIAHRLSTIMKMDRIVVLEEGRIIEEGSHEDLLLKNGLYAKLWSIQSGGFLGE